MTPKISVVMPAYNRVDTISYSIESVLAQSLDDFELILVDDCSSDDTLLIMEAYARRDRRVRVLSNPANSRLSPIQWEPRNDGLRIARGQYISYLDSDNCWRPGFLKTLVSELDSAEDLQLVYCDSKNFYGSRLDFELVIAADLRSLAAVGANWTVFSCHLDRPEDLGAGCYIDTNEIMHRSTVFSRLGYLWSTAHPNRERINSSQVVRRPYRRHNDLHLVERIVAAFGIGAVRHVPIPLVHYYYDGAPRHTEDAERVRAVAAPATVGPRAGSLDLKL